MSRACLTKKSARSSLLAKQRKQVLSETSTMSVIACTAVRSYPVDSKVTSAASIGASRVWRFLRPVEPPADDDADFLLSGEDPLELLGLDDRNNAVATFALGLLEDGPDVVEPAVVPSRAVVLSEVAGRDLMVLREPLHGRAQANADLLDERRRGDR